MLSDLADENWSKVRRYLYEICSRIIPILDETRSIFVLKLDEVFAFQNTPGELKSVDGFNTIKRLSTLTAHALSNSVENHPPDTKKRMVKSVLCPMTLTPPRAVKRAAGSRLAGPLVAQPDGKSTGGLNTIG